MANNLQLGQTLVFSSLRVISYSFTFVETFMLIFYCFKLKMFGIIVRIIRRTTCIIVVCITNQTVMVQRFDALSISAYPVPTNTRSVSIMIAALHQIMSDMIRLEW